MLIQMEFLDKILRKTVQSYPKDIKTIRNIISAEFYSMVFFVKDTAQKVLLENLALILSLLL